MVTYNSDDDALTLGDDDSLKVGDYEVEYSTDSDEFQARYGRPIGGEAGNHGEISSIEYSSDSVVGNNSIHNDEGVINTKKVWKLTDITLSAWVKSGSAVKQRLISQQAPVDGSTDKLNYFIRINNDGVASANINKNSTNGTGLSGTTQIDNSSWHHIAMTLSSDVMTLYVDGVEEDSSTGNPTGSFSGPYPTFLSALANGKESVIGNQDDSRIYDRALSESEVTDLSNGIDVTDGLVARYDFEYPETPNVAIDSTGDVYPKNSIPRNTSGSVVPSGLAESVSAGEALADDGESYSSVQDAIDAAEGWVFVGPGTFNEAVTISTEGLTLEGCGEDTLIDGETTDNDIIVNISSENVSVKNIRISSGEYRALETDAGKLIAENVYIDGSTSGGGIQLGGTSENIVSNCTIVGGNNSIQLSNEPNNIIIGNIILESDGDAIESYDGGNNIISGNIIRDSTSRGVHIINSSDDNIISHNRIHNSGNDGIGLTGSDNIIANNRVSNSTNLDIDDQGTGTELDDNLTGESN